jgi:Ca2+-binding EF-hand superfamily protein
LKFFAMVDDDHNGLLSPTEFAHIMRKVQGNFRQHSGDEATHRLRGIGESHVTKTLNDDEIQFLFNLIDTDKSGYISVKEFSEFLKEHERGENEGHWMNALDKARQEDLLENERKRKMFIEKKELMGRRRRKDRLNNGEVVGLDDYGASKFIAEHGQKKNADADNADGEKRKNRFKMKGKMADAKPPTIGSIIDYEGNVTSSSSSITMKSTRRQRELQTHEAEVWSRRLRDVPEHFKKAPGEDAAIMRRRNAEEKKRVSQMALNHRMYVPNTKWRPRDQSKDVSIYYRGQTNNNQKMKGAPNLHGFNDDYKAKVEDGRRRREQAVARMHERLSKRPMYHGQATSDNIKDEEQAAIHHRTKTSVPASERLHAHRHHKMMESAKKLSLAKNSSMRGTFYGYTPQGSTRSKKATGNNSERMKNGGGAGGAGAGSVSSAGGSMSQSSSMSELEKIAFEVEEVEVSMGGLDNLDFDEVAEQVSKEVKGNSVLVTPSSNSAVGRTTNRRQSNQPNMKTPTTMTPRRGSMKSIKSAFGSTVRMVVSDDDDNNNTTKLNNNNNNNNNGKAASSATNNRRASRRVSIRESDAPRTGERRPSTAVATSTKKHKTLAERSSSRRGSWFGMTTHEHTQRRKSMNRKKLHGTANEHGVEIRKPAHFGARGVHGTGKHEHKYGVFMTRNAHFNAKSSHAKKGNFTNPHTYKRHAPKRVVERPAFGSSVPRSPPAAEKDAPHRSPDQSNERSIEISGKSARRGGRKKRQSSGIRSPRSPPNLHRASSAGIQTGWSPSIIRGTSVTAHTHTSNHNVMSSTHRTLTGHVNSREEDLGKVANSDELFQRELRQ